MYTVIGYIGGEDMSDMRKNITLRIVGGYGLFLLGILGFANFENIPLRVICLLIGMFGILTGGRAMRKN